MSCTVPTIRSGAALCVAQDRRLLVHPAHPAVRPDQAMLDVVGRPAGDRRLARRPHRGAIVGMHEGEERRRRSLELARPGRRRCGASRPTSRGDPSRRARPPSCRCARLPAPARGTVWCCASASAVRTAGADVAKARDRGRRSARRSISGATKRSMTRPSLKPQHVEAAPSTDRSTAPATAANAASDPRARRSRREQSSSRRGESPRRRSRTSRDSGGCSGGCGDRDRRRGCASRVASSVASSSAMVSSSVGTISHDRSRASMTPSCEGGDRHGRRLRTHRIRCRPS